MDKIQNISIFASFLGLWITSSFTISFEIILGYLLILSFGILHGSNDLLILNKIPNKKGSFSFFSVLITYVLTILLAVIAFYFFPVIALVIFIISSAYHFGQQHWDHRDLNIPVPLRITNYVLYGMLVLQLIFVFNSIEVIQIVMEITNLTLSEDLINKVSLSFVIVFGLWWLYLLVKFKIFETFLLKEILYLIVLSIVFKVSTLIWSFAIYFILWHSIPSLYEQVIFIYGRFSKSNILNYVKSAFPYWLASMIGISLVYIFLRDEKIFPALLFSFIAAVTFPHTIVINHLFRNKKTQPNN